jgi:hypothetical protein
MDRKSWASLGHRHADRWSAGAARPAGGAPEAAAVSRRADPASPAAAIRALAPRIAEAAQKVYDEWEQDEDGESAEYGFGGICDDVAEAICDVVRGCEAVEEVMTFHVEADNHTVALALTADGIYEVDIPPSVYEDGQWYMYTKRPGVKIGAGDVSVSLLTRDRGRWEELGAA